VRSLLAALDSEPGFRPQGVIALELSLPDARYPDGASQDAFFRRLEERIERLPGVQATAQISHLPMSGRSTNGSFEIEGREWPEGDRPLTDKRLAGPGYFATLGIPVVRGREITERDRQGTAPVALINQTLAQLYFAGEDPIGKRIDFGWHTDGFQEIVGVVGDIRHDGLDPAPRPELYMAYAQNPGAGKALGRSVVVRVAGDPAALMPAVREQVFAVDPDQPVGGLRTLDELVAGSLTGRRLAAGLLAALGLVALLLAAIGLYGVLAYLVRQRTHEIGVRMAIGASPGDVLRRVIGRGVALAAAGAVIGLAGGLIAARLLAAQLYGVGATDPATFAAAVAVLLAATLVACTLPALSAARVDPVEALRAE
jgi:putative ABC transport system permease protein